MSGRSAFLLLVAPFVFAACSSPSDEELEDHHFELAVSGPWVIPSNIVAVAEGYPIGYTGAGPWVGSSGCSGTFTSGAQVLKDWVLANWPQVTAVGGYSCRPIVGNSSAMSVHGTGRAIDIHIPLDGTQADNGLGDPLANYLVEHADEIGVQMVIWDRWLWSPSRSPRSRSYSGSHPHHDHLHVELTPQAARQELPWYQGGIVAPTASSCAKVPAEGRVIDETDSCFVAFGPSQYWRTASGGMGGSLMWTNAYQSSTPSNWARWNLDLSQGGRWVVEYYRTSTYAKFDSTRYRVRAGSSEVDVFLDQSVGVNGWEEIGTFSFTSGANQWVEVFDNSTGPVADGQHIVVDAIRIRPEGAAPPPTDVTAGTPDGGGTSGSGAGTGDGSGSGSSGGGSDPGSGGTSDPPTGSLVDTSPDDDEPIDDGTDALPPKGSYDPEIDESYHEEPELVFEDTTPDDVHLDGHSCATTPGARPGGFGLLLALVGVVAGGLRARRRLATVPPGSPRGRGTPPS